MNRKAVFVVILIIVFIGIMVVLIQVLHDTENERVTETIYIRADGTVEGTYEIQRNGNIYTFTDNIFVAEASDGIVVERSIIKIEGAGYKLQRDGVGWAQIGLSLIGISNVIIRDLNVENFAHGVQLFNSSSCTVSGCNLTHNSVGIVVGAWLGSNNSIVRNNIRSNRDGIKLLGSSNNSIVGNNITESIQYGIWLSESSNKNSILGNNITNNWYGMQLYASNDNHVSANNIIDNNYYGVYLDHSSNNTICGNDIKDNMKYGIWLSESSNNRFYHNKVIGHLFEASTLSDHPNFWDNGYPSGGNYWGDYKERYPDAKEIDNSGAWDTPYYIYRNNEDNYPLISEFP